MAKKRTMREIIDTVNILCPGAAESVLAGILDPTSASSPQEAKDFIDKNIKILTVRLESMKSSLNIDESLALEYMGNSNNFSAEEWKVVEGFSFEMSRFGENISHCLAADNLEMTECEQKAIRKRSALEKEAKRSGWIQA